MAKSRSFSIYLLKEGYDATNDLREDHARDDGIGAHGLPEDATLFVLDSDPRPPWWSSYFGVEKNLTQVTKGALVFLSVGDRCFALSFGHVAHNLIDSGYEYDFGLRVTLNSLDPHNVGVQLVKVMTIQQARHELPDSFVRRVTGNDKDRF
ncbi:TIGR04141 family sporadically distributed protein [Rhizobium ruizarguesonis]|uniref:TIGR04141 family sporadically distributed protein n=1 Tax=Rhizobium ruizarguesonis TaxID=2081791 RepID=UPI001030E36D|nr:TIGR04141 family sporadically distributed protein [Rhizobium ruizarguesonis]TAZ88162.1 hypothetical protein ELH67_32175 [Rhizobium ruizarguesonis]TBA29456.1 hypothetical protein ELH60_32175 [Rhizobium ruizarguesonis]TBA73896.1 hypothetical protein ELH56_31585 [Rhizobium ruizarguesonis]TBC54094.1 hypothetical protein ELH36_31715 [Rhizobium ruizarguesonis]